MEMDAVFSKNSTSVISFPGSIAKKLTRGGSLLLAQLLDEIVGVSRDFPGKFDHIDPLQNDVVCFHWVRAREGRTAGQQLVHQNPKRPII